MYSDNSIDSFSDETGSDRQDDPYIPQVMIGRDTDNRMCSERSNSPPDEYNSEFNESDVLPGVVEGAMYAFKKLTAQKSSQSDQNESSPTSGLGHLLKRMFGLTTTETTATRGVSGNVRVRATGKCSSEFVGLTLTQSLRDHGHTGRTIWCMKFSHDGAFLATGDAEGRVCIWSVGEPPSASGAGITGSSSCSDLPRYFISIFFYSKTYIPQFNNYHMLVYVVIQLQSLQ